LARVWLPPVAAEAEAEQYVQPEVAEQRAQQVAEPYA
jgi:hypothetical protein